jgi:hypothetical protein
MTPNQESHRKPILLNDGSYLFASKQLILSHDADPDLEELPQLILPYFRALRVVAGQASFPRSIVAFERCTAANKIAAQAEEAPDKCVEHLFKRYIAESAVKWKHLADANDAVVNGAIPIHRELITDASEAIIEENFRSSIILSAMAVESCAGVILDREYDRLVAQVPSSREHRCVSIQVSQGELVRKDPIFALLRSSSGDGGSRFLPLLHECPLYLIGRSLSLDQPTTYSKAHALYRTRNSLAHTGTSPMGKEGLLPVSHNGAIAALETANAILAWFGEQCTPLPDNTFVRVGPKSVSA